MRNKTPKTSSKIVHGNRSEGGDFFNAVQTILSLSDGTKFSGFVRADDEFGTCGEVVFSTGMNGYVESMTDPSFAGQILVFTYPLIGNYGVDQRMMESQKIQVRGIIVSTLEDDWSHAKSDQSLREWCRSQNIPIMFGVDTRGLTKHLRSRGSMLGAFGKTPLPKSQSSTVFVSIEEPIVYPNKGKKRVIFVDCGTKENITRSLQNLPIEIKRVPYDYDFTQEAYDGIFISNGPGDPTDYTQTIAHIRQALKVDKPVFGICLGSQLVALAAGAKTYKLTFGNRGHNQPCMDLDSNRCYITSQNHGYAVDETTLPKGWRVTFRNLNDGSVEGIAHNTKPFYTVQFHPEACPGPTDTAFIFERFYTTL